MRIGASLAVAVVLGGFAAAPAAAQALPSVGAPVPAFAVTDQDGGAVGSAALLGKRYVLAFYPRDFTPG